MDPRRTTHRPSIFDGRHINHRSSKVGTLIFESRHIDLRRSTRRSSIFEGRHIDLRRPTHQSSKVDTSIFEGRHIDLRRSKAETSHRQPNIALTFQQFVTEYCPHQRSKVILKIPRGTYNIRRYTSPYTYIRRQPHTCTSYVLYAYLYCIYVLVGRAINIRDPYICAVS